MKVATATNVKELEIRKFTELDSRCTADLLSVEEPLEIRLVQPSLETPRQVAVTMRTPGNDSELSAGFLFTEGIISDKEEIEKIIVEKCNVSTVFLNSSVELDPSLFERHSFISSSCGVCGKKSISAVKTKRQHQCTEDGPIISPELIHLLPDALQASQSDFNQTGGIHASCLFNLRGEVLTIKEDVGRHNAVDKLIGSEFMAGNLPLSDRILLVSGRASFELVQKAAQAGIPIMAAVGAPSSLAVELAKECGMTLIGFVRQRRFNVYSGFHRIACD
jgi:FdhD protein